MQLRLNKSDRLLTVEGLTIEFANNGNVVRAVDNIGFGIGYGKTLALVGESGSGKSVTALSMTRLLNTPPARYVSGKILFENRNLLQASESELQTIRGKKIAYIFQEPSTSLNPVLSVSEQIGEVLHLHRPEITDPFKEIRKALTLVGIQDPDRCANAYPHELSGGMQQRIMIAMAVACQPHLLIADEPTTALDTTVQAQIMALLKDIKKRLDVAILLITHNFGIIADFADEIAVMYRGKIVEAGPASMVLECPQHPYTRQLMACIPKIGQNRRRLPTINYDEIHV